MTTKATSTKTTKAKQMIQLRQGDVWLQQVEKMTTKQLGEPLKRTKRGIVLQEGTATGHAHRIANRAASLHMAGDVRYLRVVESVTLVHEEHDTVAIPVGDYRVSLHHEYQPGELPRQVWD